ncbi:hypothetical protein [uncultured Piscinibacter sp.]|uniref:hypothetical protein n=1 Tax=uncultured Piscinibacter sp. TaxID=1131835 RepID=UPI00262DEF4B|nr:hypothetical protein [uncultured Piscinibacter sp.]
MLCLLGVVPAFVTGTLPATSWLPGTEGFRWAWFDLSLARPLSLALLLAASVVGWPLRPRWLWLAMLPLLLLVLTPISRVGAADGPLHWIERDRGAEDPAFEAERTAIERLAAPAGRVERALARLPPALPDAAALRSQWQALDAARPDRMQGGGARLRQLSVDLAQLQAAFDQAPRAQASAADPQRKELAARYAQAFADHERLRRLMAGHPPPAAQVWALRAQLGLHELWHADKRARWLEAPYQLAGSLLVLAVIGALGVGHRVVLAFVGLALLASFVSAAGCTGGGWVALAIAALQPVLVGALALLMLRLLARAWLDNREIWRSTPAPALRRALLWSLLLWSPFALVLGANFWAGRTIGQAVEQTLYRISLPVPEGQPPAPALLRDSDDTRPTLREDLHVAVARLYADIEDKGIGAARGAGGNTAAAAQRMKKASMEAFDDVLRDSIFQYDGVPRRRACLLWDPLACIANIPLDMANAAYQGPRNRIRADLEARLEAAIADARQAADAGSASVEAALRSQAAQVSKLTREQIDDLLLVSAGVSALGSATLLFVAARAFLLMLARLLFAQNKDAFMTITPRERSLPTQARPVRVDVPEGDELHLHLERGRLLMKPAFDVDGAAPNTLWLPPQPWRAALARIRHGCYFLKEIEAGDEPRTLTLKSTPGTNFFCWDIPEDAEVAFRWDRFAGMSGSVRLRRVFSFKLGTVVLGHVSVATARGPGLLVQHAYTRASAQRTSVAQARVVGWVMGTLFRVESGKSKKNVYVDHCHVVCAEPGVAVHEAAREGRGGHGLWRELLGLLRP